jgi:hypothetical protein
VDVKKGARTPLDDVKDKVREAIFQRESEKRYKEYMAKLKAVVTMGDPAGIGGELLLKAFQKPFRTARPVIVGDLSVLEALAGRLFKDMRFPFKPFGEGTGNDIEILDVGAIKSVRFGLSDDRCGEASYLYIMAALGLFPSWVIPSSSPITGE